MIAWPPMNVSYLGPLRRAWSRSQRMLFRPFRFSAWLVLGFAAFLSEFNTRGGYQFHLKQHASRILWPHASGPSGIFGGMLWTGLGALLLAGLVILGVLLAWINSRGRFVFLDDVIHERAAIVQPWQLHARLANSLFGWTLIFAAVCAVLAILMALPFVAVLTSLWSEGRFRWEMLGALWVLLAMFLPFVVVAATILLALGDFVVPIMLRQGIGVLAAWSRFLALLRAHPGPFVGYALFVFGLSVLVAAALLALGVATCGVGLVLFTLPYVSSVVLLPIHVTFRGLGPEFLAQFGPEYDVLAASPAPGA